MIVSTIEQESLVLTARGAGGATRQCRLHCEQGVFVGASTNCGLRLPGKEVADIHCRIELHGGVVFAQDWMSASGTRINGQSITGRTEVSCGDLIEIGEHRIVVEKQSCQSQAEFSAEDAGADKPSPGLESGTSLLRDLDPLDQLATADFDDSLEQTLSSGQVDADPIWDSASDSEWGSDPHQAFLTSDEDEVYDRETIELLKAEIEDLRAALSIKDAGFEDPVGHQADLEDPEPDSDTTLRRMQELIDEANRSDERASMLEEILHAAEDTNRSEREERYQLEAWVADIEQRIGQRENEHAAEIKAIAARLETSERQREEMHRSLRTASSPGGAPSCYEETVEKLQSSVRTLTDELAESRETCKALEQKLEQIGGEQEGALREERAQIAQERARLSRLRFELSSKLSGLESLPKTENQTDKEMAHKLQTLRQHLREIHEQEKREEREAPLATRLAKLWRRVEY